MPSDDAFLRAILDEPDDDAPRLVYADWLEEQGDADRAEFIRAQIELARLPAGDRRGPALRKREAALLKVNKSRWLGSLHGVLTKEEFRRGFLEKVVIQNDLFVVLVGPLLDSTPLRSLSIKIKLDEAEYTDLVDEGLAVLVDHPRAVLLTELDLTDTGMTEEAIEGLARVKAFKNLRSLNLTNCEMGPRAVKALMHSPVLRHLQELRVGVQHNYREFVYLDDEAVQVLLASPRWRQLTTFCAESAHASEASLVRLIESPHTQLHKLELSNCSLTERTVQALIDDPERAARWRHLGLAGDGLNNNALRPLAQSPHLGNLATLDVRGNRASLAFAQALVKSPSLQALTRLELGGNPVPPAGKELLKKRFGARVCRFS